MTRLYLIRHGQAHANVQPLVTVPGPKGDAGLTPLGVQQAERLRDRLIATGEIAADVLIASTLPRALQTAQIIAPALGGLPIIPDDDVREISFGDWDGLPWEQIKDLLPDHRVEPYRSFGPGGENYPRFHARVAEALDRIITEHAGKCIVVVCHGGVVDSSFGYFFDLPTLAPGKMGLLTSNTSITLWEEEPHEGYSLRWRLVRYNDDLHIRDLAMPERLGWVRLAPEAQAGGEEPTVADDAEDRAP